ncbi:hypothetical protein M422DRAFT_273741 [Sphaerobolus stellatus SS14]|uniref:Uncharacterized protein n=1 Tax=Sphaerobolus stellatus (strain SS14) TaxID=990650 RepID=A0A0C9T8H8_SPHS4|nr:hypothetical protein M422DRAFT_273741 [Sphaerobolus stellatus SS14]
MRLRDGVYQPAERTAPENPDFLIQSESYQLEDVELLKEDINVGFGSPLGADAFSNARSEESSKNDSPAGSDWMDEWDDEMDYNSADDYHSQSGRIKKKLRLTLPVTLIWMDSGTRFLPSPIRLIIVKTLMTSKRQKIGRIPFLLAWVRV